MLDVIENVGVNVFDKMRIKDTQLIKRIEFVNLALRILFDHHIELLDVLDIQIFPELVRRLWLVIFRLKYLLKRKREGFIKIDMSKHIPCIGSADRNTGDSIHCSRLNAPFFGGAFSILSRIKCFPNVCLKRIVEKVIIA